MKKYFLAIFMFLTSFSSQGQSLSGKEIQIYNEVFIKCTKALGYTQQAVSFKNINKSPQEAFNNLKQTEEKNNASLKKNGNPKFNASLSDAQLKKIVNDAYFGPYKYANMDDFPDSTRLCHRIASENAKGSTKKWNPLK